MDPVINFNQTNSNLDNQNVQNHYTKEQNVTIQNLANAYVNFFYKISFLEWITTIAFLSLVLVLVIVSPVFQLFVCFQELIDFTFNITASLFNNIKTELCKFFNFSKAKIETAKNSNSVEQVNSNNQAELPVLVTDENVVPELVQPELPIDEQNNCSAAEYNISERLNIQEINQLNPNITTNDHHSARVL